MKTYRHWMENIRDWCISRQLWWGHRIPAYTCEQCGEIVVAKGMPEKCPKCGCTHLVQEEDVLDTWFSSWLWPFSTFGWPDNTADLKAFYPTQTLVTGPDIIFFWVARMIMAGIEFMGDIPFKDVYFTSIIRDEKGRKMSKSLGNSPDPLDVIATYGADALRFTVIYIAPVGQDIRYSNEKCEIGRNFANKIWNVVRFRLMQGPVTSAKPTLDNLGALRPDDQWILASLNQAIKEVTDGLANFRFNEVSKVLYEFIWSKFCDWYLESCKPVFNGGDAAQKQTVLRLFDYCVATFLKLLHPIMPFVTDELYHQMGSEDVLNGYGATQAAEDDAEAKFELIRAIRAVRANYGIATSKALDMVVAPANDEMHEFLKRDEASFKALVNAGDLKFVPGYQPEGPSGVAVSTAATAYIPLAGIVDLDAEKKRLEKQEAELAKYVGVVEKKLSNEKFVSKAPADVVAQERAKLAEAQEKLARVREQMKAY